MLVAFIMLFVAFIISWLNYSSRQIPLSEVLAKVKPDPENIKTMGLERATQCAIDFATYFYEYEHDLLPENDTTFDDLMQKYYPDDV